MKNVGRRRFYQSNRFWFVALAVVAFAWIVQGPVLSFAARQLAGLAFSQQGLVFYADSVRAGLFVPLQMEGVKICSSHKNGGGTVLKVERFKLLWSGPNHLFSDWKNWIRSISLDGVAWVLDLRNSESSGPALEPGFNQASPAIGLLAPGGLWADNLEIRNASGEVLGENFRHVFDGLNISLNSKAHGRLGLQSLTIQAGKFNKVFGPFSAPTTWDEGNASFAGLDLLPGVTLSDVSLRLGAFSGPLLSFSARVFGGALRGDLSLSEGPRGRVWDVAAFGSNISLEGIPALLDLPGKAAGTLAEGRLTFRGDAARPVDADASLRVLAKDFRWNDRGWESLEIGASLIHRRLLVSNFDLRQKENKVTINGEISLAEGWAKIAESPFLANVRANIKELNSLAGLLGGSLGQTSGQLTAEGSVSGRPGSLDGFLGIRANGVVYHSIPVERMNLEILFRKKQAELVRCEMISGSDSLNAKGLVDLAAPHAYSAELGAKLAEVATYLRPFYSKGDAAVSGGAMGITWKGSGMVGAHSGEFDVDLSRFVSSLTPAGLTGHFEGFYSPENVYFSELDLENGNMHLRSRANISVAGLTLEGVEFTAASKPLLSGSAFLPVDSFALARGADWKTAVLQSGAMYLQANTPAEIDLRDLLRLGGQDLPLSGFLKMQLEASGLPASPDITGLIQGRDIAFGIGDVPSSKVFIDTKAKSGVARLEGRIESAGMATTSIKASFPFGLSQAEDGTLRWFDSKAPLSAEVEMPRLDLALARPLLPFLHNLRGEISGYAKVTNTIEAPEVSGELEVRSTSFAFQGLDSDIERLHGKISVGNGTLGFRNIEGEVARGRFAMDGVCDFSEFKKPRWDLTWRADRIPLVCDSMVSLLVSGQLQAKGQDDEGTLSGSVGFEGSLIKGKFLLEPLLSQKSLTIPNFSAPSEILSKLSPSPAWILDVKINGGLPVEVRGARFSAFLKPALSLGGTVAKPVPVGRVTLDGVEAGGFFIESGSLFFLPDEPWNPFLLVEGEGWFANESIRLFAFGPLSEGKWILSSETLPQAIPQALFLAIDQGLATVSFEGLPPVDIGVYQSVASGALRLVTSRIESDSVWRNGIKFSESLDLAPRAGIFPIDSFRSGFDWRLRPVF